MQEIYLRNIGKNAVLDDDDYERLKHHGWFGYKNLKKDKHFYARATVNHRAGTTTILHLHREVMKAKRGDAVTFRNRNRLDCRKENLVVASRSVIRQHGASHEGIDCRYRGVEPIKYCGKPTGKWKAMIMHEGRTHYLGSFVREIDAARAYDRAARRFYGDLASTNFKKPKKKGKKCKQSRNS